MQARGCNCSKEEQEIATLLLAGDIDAIFGLFEGGNSVKPSRVTYLPFEEHRRNVLAVKSYIPDEGSTLRSRLPTISFFALHASRAYVLLCETILDRLNRMRNLRWRSCDCPLCMPYRHLFCLRQAFLRQAWLEKLPKACNISHNYEEFLLKM